MKILLVGEYSNVHWTLAEGLRKLGHDVTVLSNGDFWKNYPRDIDLSRKSGKWGGICYMARLYSLLPKLKGYDVVQLINPMFLELKAERIFSIYDYLRQHNGKVFLGAFGMDFYWMYVNSHQMPLRYSDFNIGKELRQDYPARMEMLDWKIGTAKHRLNKMIVKDCDGVIAGLYEYWVSYHQYYAHKLSFIPFPIVCTRTHPILPWKDGDPVKLFIGINRSRSLYKGTDIMLRAAQDIVARYPERVELQIALNVPFARYREMMRSSHALLDQLYSYTPSMNPLEAMSQGIVCIGGGEPENYSILNETQLRPIINVEPKYESVYEQLERLVLHPEVLPDLQQQSIDYVRKHHDYLKVARQYLDVYQGKTPVASSSSHEKSALES